MSEPSSSAGDSSPRLPIDAGAFGIGLGTAVALFAERLPEDAAAKPWLLVFAPTISVAISHLWIRMRSHVRDLLDQRDAQRIFREAKQTLEDGLNNPNTSQEHKDQLRDDLELLERDFIKNKTDRFRAKLRS